VEVEVLEERVAGLEKTLGELTRAVYQHAFALANLSREFGLHYHRRDGNTLPFILESGDKLLSYVASVSFMDDAAKQRIEEYERDPQAFLKSNYGDLFYWPWE